MPMEITFELSDDDLEYFQRLMLDARSKLGDLDEATIIDKARQLLAEVWQSETSDFIRERMSQLETLIGMVVDNGWGMENEPRTGGAVLFFRTAGPHPGRNPRPGLPGRCDHD